MKTPNVWEQSAEKHGEYVAQNVKTISTSVSILAIIGLIFGSLVAGNLTGIGILAVAAFSCAAVGAALGFLFSIPKSAQNADSLRTNSPSHPNLIEIPRDNTNLEQISDWFVKILIGASLVQLESVKNFFDTVATNLSQSIFAAQKMAAPGATIVMRENLSIDPFYHPFCLFFILFYLTLGFLGSYLITRLWLPLTMLKSGLAMESAQRANNLETLNEKVKELEAEDSNLTFLQDTLDALRYALRGFEDYPPKPDKSSIRLAFDRAKECLNLFPNHRTLTILIGRLHKELGNYDEAIPVLTKFIKEWQNAKKKEDADFAAVLYNLACYQNLKAEKITNPEQAELLRQTAWSTLKKSCSIDPANKTEAIEDEDLKTLLAPPRSIEQL